MTYALRQPSPGIIALQEQFKPWHLEARELLPELSIEDISGLVIAPDQTAPLIFERQAGRWPTEDAADIEQFLSMITLARVETWLGPARRQTVTSTNELTQASTITIASEKGNQRIRIDDGTVDLPDRGVYGRLNERSQQMLLGDQ